MKDTSAVIEKKSWGWVEKLAKEKIPSTIIIFVMLNVNEYNSPAARFAWREQASFYSILLSGSNLGGCIVQ